MEGLYKKIELIANLCIIIVSALILFTVARRYVNPPSYHNNRSLITSGTKLSLDGVDWQKSDKTLLMALSTSCRFCAESLPFYRKIAQQKERGKSFRLIAMFPQSIAESREYLDENRISVDEILQAPRHALFIRATPTLILVDNTGSVIRSWVGKLSPDEEIEVLNNLRNDVYYR
jgi:thioredoxin-related protein